jgi:hypothetical protein
MRVLFAEEGYADQGNGSVEGSGVLGPALLRAENGRDAMGRVTQYLEYDAYGGVTHNRYAIVYDARNLVLSDSVSQKRIENGVYNSYLTHTSNGYGAGGELSWTVSDNWVNGSDANMKDTRTSFAHVWYDEARVASSTHDADTDSGSNPVWTSSYHYDGLGRLASVGIADGRPRTVSFASAPGGQVLLRAERSAAAQNPLDQRYFVSGVQVGEITSNGNNDPERIDYGQSLRVRNWTSNPEAAPFRWNTQTGVPEATFGGAGFDPINPLSGGMAGTSGRYNVQDGDTLAGIAAGLWGDASLWYMLAEANGLSGSESLTPGTSLIVPSKVTNIRNNAQTFEVYDPSRALGDLSPTAPRPPKKGNKCGVFGQVLLTVVALAVTAITMPLVGPVGAAMLGSAVSQGVGVATGIQEKFSWKGVAIAGITAAVTLGIGGAPLGAGAGAVANDVARGILASTVTQGIGVATGLQSKFSWAGVAAAGVISGVGGAVGRSLPGRAVPATATIGGRPASFGNQTLSSAAGAIAGAATRSLVTGTSFGDNVMAVLPDVIGSTIGNAIGYGVSARGETSMARLGGEGGIEFAQNVDPGVRSDHGEIVVTATRKQVEAAKRGFFGSIHESLSGIDHFFGGLFRSGNRRSIDTGAIARSISMTIRRAPSATAEFGRGLAHGVYNVGANVVTGVYHLVTTSPLTTIKSTGRALAGGIDSILAAENTPARGQLSRAANSLSNASAYDLGYGAGNVAGNVVLLVAPELFAGRAGAAGRITTVDEMVVSHPLAGAFASEVVGMAATAGLQTPRDSLILWSGLGPDGALRAQSFAKQFGGTTLEMTPGGKWLDGMDLYGPASPFTSAEADMIWGEVSARMVGQASGQVRSVLGQVRPGSVYKTYELPALRENSAILGLDPLQVRPMMKARGY